MLVDQALIDKDLPEVLAIRHPIALVAVVAHRLLATQAQRQALAVQDIRGSMALPTVEAVAARLAETRAVRVVPVVVVLVLFIPVWRGLQTQVAVVAVVGLIREAPAVTAGPASS